MENVGVILLLMRTGQEANRRIGPASASQLP
jgi:hypothetical protein